MSHIARVLIDMLNCPDNLAHDITSGIDSDVTGTILGVYYASTMLASPIMAILMTKLGQTNILQVYCTFV